MSALTQARFLECLTIYGADISRWPIEVQSEAQNMLSTADDALRAAYDAELEFDLSLAPAGENAPLSIDFETALLASAPLPGALQKPTHWLASLIDLKTPRWASAGLVSACLMGGLGVGYSAAQSEQELASLDATLEYVTLSAQDLLSDLDLEIDE